MIALPCSSEVEIVLTSKCSDRASSAPRTRPRRALGETSMFRKAHFLPRQLASCEILITPPVASINSMLNEPSSLYVVKLRILQGFTILSGEVINLGSLARSNVGHNITADNK